MKKSIKKALAFSLVLALMLGLGAVSALAEYGASETASGVEPTELSGVTATSSATTHDVSDSGELTAALSGLTDGDVINITETFTHYAFIELRDVSVELRLNGNTLTIDSPGPGGPPGVFALRLGHEWLARASLDVQGPGTLNVMRGRLEVYNQSSLSKNGGAVVNASNVELLGNSTAAISSATGNILTWGGELTVTGNVGGRVTGFGSTIVVNGNIGGGITAVRGRVTVGGDVTSTGTGVSMAWELGMGYIADPNPGVVVIRGTLTATETFISFSREAGGTVFDERTPEQYDSLVTRNGNTYRLYTSDVGSVYIRTEAPPSPAPAPPTFTQGSGAPLVITLDIDYADFYRLSRDGVYLERGENADYTARPGSTIITLFPRFLNTLPTGAQNLTAHLADGTTEPVNFTITAPTAEAPPSDPYATAPYVAAVPAPAAHNVPQTGITGRMILPLVLGLLGFALIAGTIGHRLYMKKKDQS